MKKTTQVSFRITEKQAEQLDRRRGTSSRGECARQLVVSGLEGQSGQDFQNLLKHLSHISSGLEEQCFQQTIKDSKTQQQVDTLGKQLQMLREDIAVTLVVVLMHMGESLTEKEAKDVVVQTPLAKQQSTK